MTIQCFLTEQVLLSLLNVVFHQPHTRAHGHSLTLIHFL